MRYQEPSKDIENDITSIVVEDDADFIEEEFVAAEPASEQIRKLKTRQSTLHNLNARRAIEEHLERVRLRKEIDYLFDEGLNEDN
jgi:hypothetical protein